MSAQWEEFKAKQPTAEKMLRNALQRDRLAHAYLFEGIKGIGKVQASKLLAQSFFCINQIDHYLPCGECHHCRRIESGNHPDVHIIEPDGQSIKKGQIQALQMEFSKSGMESAKKFYCLVHADRMTTNAANSLLKFLEEPQAQTMAVLITEQLHNMLSTILSRCQVVSFKPLSANLLIKQLISNGIPQDMAPLLSQLTQNVDEAQQLFSDEWFAQARKKVVKLYEALQKSDEEALLWLQQEWYKHFQDREQVNMGLQMLLFIYRDLLSIQLNRKEKLIFPFIIGDLERSALSISQTTILKSIETILNTKRMLDAHTNHQLLMEQMVLSLKEGS
ncbi:MAG TPA: DNA polymerase III subunit delta' [Bacillus sp. (in: firmicutes)]|uniref:DNA polymerase III subunit delta' n=1 Tax=Bacillus litorisediminis TaxID=2922713 RepID=UPI002436119C|nr:DNA polymerase III subunit delta' [Bacillus litorisediminis]HWO76071.1 DNA polymerase III subunit delta' [Bacillus sp. (in: firmicutes)]